jgi:hypothetical protein
MEPSLASQTVGTRTRSIRRTQRVSDPLSSGNIEFINARCRSKRSQPRIERSEAISRPFRGEGILFCIDPKSGRRWKEKGDTRRNNFSPPPLGRPQVGPTLQTTPLGTEDVEACLPANPSQTGDDATIMHATSARPPAPNNQLTQRVSSRVRYAEMTRLLPTDPNAASAMQAPHGDGMINGRQGRQPCTGGRVERKRKRLRLRRSDRERSGPARRAAAWLCFIGTRQPVSSGKATLTASVSDTRRHRITLVPLFRSRRAAWAFVQRKVCASVGSISDMPYAGDELAERLAHSLRIASLARYFTTGNTVRRTRCDYLLVENCTLGTYCLEFLG